MDIKPKYLVRGEVARLIPVIADSGKEQRATSALLSVFSAVPSLANILLSDFGQKITQRSSVNTFTEVVLENAGDGKDRPDGLIVIRRGSKTWSALVETKIGKSRIEQDQIERYLKLARLNYIDALISISNEFVARPNHHPLNVSKSLLKKVDWFHLSWTSILTQAILLHENSLLEDAEQAFLSRELVRFLSHDSAGVTGYSQMPSCWSDSINTLKSGGSLRKHSTEVLEIVGGWHQKTRELSLQLSQLLSRQVTVELSKTHTTDPDNRIHSDIDKLCKENTLNASFNIPNAAASIVVCADLKSRGIRVSMTVNAPKDRQKTTSRLNWLLKQLKEADPVRINIGLIWASSARNTHVPLELLLENVNQPEITQSKVLPRAFEVILNVAPGAQFSGRKTFIRVLEATFPQFYDNVGQYLKNWQPKRKLPKLKIPKKLKEIPNTEPIAGNEHDSLLEIPEFLRRMQNEPVLR